HHFFVAWQKQPCGFIHLKEIELSDTPQMVSQRRLEIEALSVENAYQKQGVGEALLTHAADFAREKQFATLTLNFWAKNQVADFYQRNGFQVERYRASKIL
ncbi:GNAT family N-acetyltransferase, partial [Enterococcus sp. RTP21361st1_A6_RTP21361_211029]